MIRTKKRHTHHPGCDRPGSPADGSAIRPAEKPANAAACSRSAKARRLMLSVLVLALLLAACGNGGNHEDAGGKPATLKVLYWNEQSFFSEYGMLYSALNPNVEFEVVSTMKIQVSDGENYEDKLDAFIRDEQPDILLLDLEQYEKYAADGRLASLEPYLTRDKVDLEGFVPGLVEVMREKGGGELYGLTPYFSSQAVYYNKDLFDRYGIEYPTDNMSWEELLHLAARFPTDGEGENRVYGLNIGYYTDLFLFGQRIGMTLGLREVNPADMRVSIDTESWRRVFEMALNAMKSGAVYTAYTADGFSDFEGGYEEFLLRDPFIGGRTAMTIEGTYMMQQIREASEYVPDKAVKNWDLVTMPVDPSNPGYTNDFSYYNIFAISADSANRDAAWDFIRYIHSDDYARIMSKTLSGMLPVRTKYIRDEEGRNMAAFYALKPTGSNAYAGYENLPDDFFMQYYTLGTEEMQAVMDDRKTVAEALGSLQTRLQAALDEALENQNGEGAFPQPDQADAGEASASAQTDGPEAEDGSEDVSGQN